MIINNKKSASYLIYTDRNKDLKNKAYELAKDIFLSYNLDLQLEDTYYYENIKIEDCRNISRLMYGSSFSGCKIFILNINNMRIEAYNALLKIIEEPMNNSFFILYSNTISKIPATILSRLIKIYIKDDLSSVEDNIYSIFYNDIDYIDEYNKADNISLEDYKINTYEDARDILSNYFSSNKNLHYVIKYEYLLRYMVSTALYLNRVEKLKLIQDIIDVLSDNRDNSVLFLNNLLLKLAFKLNIDKYKELVRIKNSIRNNVLTKYAIYLFLCIILKEE